MPNRTFMSNLYPWQNRALQNSLIHSPNGNFQIYHKDRQVGATTALVKSAVTVAERVALTNVVVVSETMEMLNTARYMMPSLNSTGCQQRSDRVVLDNGSSVWFSTIANLPFHLRGKTISHLFGEVQRTELDSICSWSQIIKENNIKNVTLTVERNIGLANFMACRNERILWIEEVPWYVVPNRTAPKETARG